jgi:hypothetical protein
VADGDVDADGLTDALDDADVDADGETDALEDAEGETLADALVAEP